MTAKGSGVLAIWHDIEPAAEAEVIEWYQREHHAERVAVPGFLGARRYVALEGEPAWFIRYATTSPAVLASPAYRARLDDPTPWTQRCLPHFRNMSRTVCRVLACHGEAEGGIVLTLRLTTGGTALRPQPLAELLAEAATARGIIATELWQAEHAASALPSREKALRGGPDRQVDLVAVVHAGELLPLAPLSERLTAAGLATGAQESTAGLYRLAFALRR